MFVYLAGSQLCGPRIDGDHVHNPTLHYLFFLQFFPPGSQKSLDFHGTIFLRILDWGGLLCAESRVLGWARGLEPERPAGKRGKLLSHDRRSRDEVVGIIRKGGHRKVHLTVFFLVSVLFDSHSRVPSNLRRVYSSLLIAI